MAQPSDNTLGAPAEGLGQNVTFAFNVPGMPTMELADPGRIRAGIVGGPPGELRTRPTGINATLDTTTLDFLAKAGNGVFNKYLEQKKTEGFVVGMQRAMQGEAVQDIAASEPWYSKLFGESDVVEGARAYYGNTTAQTVVGAMQDDMPRLRTLDGPAAQKYFVEQVNATKTGDPAADLAIMQSMIRVMPQVMRLQAKEHYGWQQEQATAAEDASFKSGAALLQRIGDPLSKGYLGPEEYKTAAIQFARQNVPPVGRDMGNWKQAQAARIIGAAHAGQFHAVGALTGPLEPGGVAMLDLLDVDQQDKVRTSMESGMERAISKYSFDYSDDLAKIETLSQMPEAGRNTQEYAAIIDSFNARFMTSTGAARGPITPARRAALLAGNRREIQQELQRQAGEQARRAEKAAEAGDAAAAEEAFGNTVQQFASTGDLGALVAHPKFSPEKANMYFMRAFTQMGDPKSPAMITPDQAKLLTLNLKTQYVVKPVQDRIEGAVDIALSSGPGAPFSSTAAGAWQNYKTLRETGPAVARAYGGKHYEALEGMYQDEQAGIPPEEAFRQRFLTPKPLRSFTSAERKTVLGDLSDANSTSWYNPMAWGNKTKVPLEPGQADRIVTAVESGATRIAEVSGDVSKAVEGEMARMSQDGRLEVIGGFAINQRKGSKRLGDYLQHTAGPNGEPPIASGEPMDHVVNEAVKAQAARALTVAYKGRQPADVESIHMFRIDDAADGTPQYSMLVLDDQNQQHNVLWSAKDAWRLTDKGNPRRVIGKVK